MKFQENQVVLPLNLGINIPTDDPVVKLNEICDELNYSELYAQYERSWRKFDPKMLFKILVYGYMTGNYSCRDIERACKRDICFMWLLNGSAVPDNSTIARFQNERLLPVIEKLFYQVVEKLYEMKEIKFENIFVDGTKIEANANKYTFVWKKVIEKNSVKLREKSKDKIISIKEKYSIKEDVEIVECIEKLRQQAALCGIVFVQGKGKHKTQLQRDIEYLEEVLNKQGEYAKYLELIGEERNSLSKTDVDATFMHLKEDHMKNGQLKPAYNIQIGVESEYIVGIGSYTDRTDVKTLIPFLTKIYENTGKKPANVIADAGYESEDNYRYLEEEGQTSYIKPSDYERSKTIKYKRDIYRMENMAYDQEPDEFTCVNGQKLYYVRSEKPDVNDKYKKDIRHYRTESCVGCPHRDKCYQSKKEYREVRVSFKFYEKRKQSLENITTDKGIELRMNRSIQVEGAFGVIKQDMGFRRFLTRGKRKTETQFYLLAIAFNICKLCSRLENDRFNQDLFKLKDTA